MDELTDQMSYKIESRWQNSVLYLKCCFGNLRISHNVFVERTDVSNNSVPLLPRNHAGLDLLLRQYG